MLVALIPVKDLPKAKARLSSVLDESGRRELTTALYRDALAAAVGCAAVDSVGVVSSDADALALATEAGAEAMPDTDDLNESLDSAARTLAERGVDRVLVIHADLPFASSAAIGAVACSSSDVALVSSGDGGTNAMVCRPGAFGFRYGPGSAQAHKEAAWNADLEPELLDVPELTLDIDMPIDLERLQEAIEAGQAAGEHTMTALETLGFISAPRRTRPS